MMLMVSPTGARFGKADHPAIPLTIPEIVASAVACVGAGADALHLHIRDAEGRHSLDPDIYAKAIERLARALPDLPVQVTSEAAGIYDTTAQRVLVETLAPRWISLSLRELARNREDAEAIYRFCTAHNIEMQHIIYDVDDAALLHEWQEQGVLGLEESVILVLGRYSDSQTADIGELAPLRAALPPIGRWMVCAFGPTEHECLTEAVALGGDVRVGFENSLTRYDGTPWSSVSASVAALRSSLGEI